MPENSTHDRMIAGAVAHPTYYDAQLVEVRTDPPRLVLAYQGRAIALPVRAGGGDWRTRSGDRVGVARWDAALDGYRFEAYLDQSLRRVVELDDGARIGWSNAANLNGWTAPRGILPGSDGAFIEDDTVPVRLAVPPEFFDLAEHYGLAVEAILQNFIADACGLESLLEQPRADGYCANGSDEALLVGDYLERAYGHLRAADDDAETHLV
ncbi:hypothetical protein [Thiocystis violacea]|uniref:hypothetical protein n=1 Tax=Thiocystis violacea TaxID=13725 RepID=UPI0019085BB7|nr:hypothetical protein [Thiocystis violacea]MBK1718103.1 hypothetical protein [Thiocystis violacea]